MKSVMGMVCVASALALLATRTEASICEAVPGNLVANCGFESGDFTGWTLVGNDVPLTEGNLYGVEGTDFVPLPDGTAPNSGAFQAFFADQFADQFADPITLSQTLTTVPGAQYSITFFLSEHCSGQER
jgi:hypothetical protein